MVDINFIELLNLQKHLTYYQYDKLGLVHLILLKNEVDERINVLIEKKKDERKHAPVLTIDGNPAHGCEMCDGDDYCCCPHKGWYPKCIICGGEWPKCDPTRKEYEQNT